MHINKLALNPINSWPQGILIISSCCLITFMLALWLTINPTLKELRQSQQRELDLFYAYEMQYPQGASLQKYQQQIVLVESLLKQVLTQLPPNFEVPNLIEDIAKLGAANGLEFELIQPETEVSEALLTVLSIKVIVTGQYHQLAKFISDIAMLQQMVIVGNFMVSHSAVTTNHVQKSRAENKLTLDMIVKIFRYSAPKIEFS